MSGHLNNKEDDNKRVRVQRAHSCCGHRPVFSNNKRDKNGLEGEALSFIMLVVASSFQKRAILWSGSCSGSCLHCIAGRLYLGYFLDSSKPYIHKYATALLLMDSEVVTSSLLLKTRLQLGTPVVPAFQEAEAERSLDPRSSRL